LAAVALYSVSGFKKSFLKTLGYLKKVSRQLKPNIVLKDKDNNLAKLSTFRRN